MLNDILGLNTLKPVVDFVVSLNALPQVADNISFVSVQVVKKLSNLPGITQCHGLHFQSAIPKFKLKDGTSIKTYKNSVGIDYIFLANSSGKMIFGGYVGWMHSDYLESTIAEIKKNFV